MSIDTVIATLGLADTVLGQVLSKRGTKIERKRLAVTLMRRATNNTRVYLETNNHLYQPNAELSNLWNDAFAAMESIDKSLARRLDDKSRFWSNPYQWLAVEAAMERVPDLAELEEKCDQILVELERRR